MSTAICYFSGTGNSRHAADRLVAALPSARLEPIVELLSSGSPVVEADIAGIVFPIHAFTIPHVVARFLKDVEFRNVSYVFALSTRLCSSSVAARIDRLLRRKDLRLGSFHAVLGPQSYLPTFPVATDCDAVRMDTELDSAIPAIAKAIERRDRVLPHDPFVLAVVARTLFMFMRLIYRVTDSFRLGKRFYADSRCTGCGICTSVCLAKRIDLHNDKPVWNSSIPCMQCFACLHYCPEGAIQIKSTTTPKKGRFHFPGITHRVIAEQRPKG
jgi:Pyruvate/2-oxoacid:ferredoxin oxidoreductase delta subunit